jgi:hypothetical protein
VRVALEVFGGPAYAGFVVLVVWGFWRGRGEGWGWRKLGIGVGQR